MSALTAALATFDCPNAHNVVPLVVPHDELDSSALCSPLSGSPQSSYSSLSECASTSSSYASSLSPPTLSVILPTERPNEHLAVLLPKHLWKSDSAANECDRFFCRVKFSMMERRHHCRKCGGVFCGKCSDKATRLLDTSELDFIHPPRNVPLSSFESPRSPLVLSRVCLDCYDQIYGAPATPELLSCSTLSSPDSIPEPVTPVSAPHSRSASPHRFSSDRRSVSSRNSSKRRNAAFCAAAHLPLPSVDQSYGELDAYPLKRSSILCKASGGGRWEPTQTPVLVGYRVPVPGGKAPYEVQLEKEEARERRRKENPIIKDGEFQYRFPRDPEPMILSRSFQLSTF